MPSLSPQQRLLLEATRHLEDQTYLFGGGQSAAVNCFIWKENHDWKKDAISQCRRGLLDAGLLVKTNKRIELTESGRQALENGNGNGNGAIKDKALPDGLDPATRRKLDRLAEILSGGNCGWCELDRLVTDYGVSCGLASNAVALQPERFAIREGRLFLLTYQKNSGTMTAAEYEEWLCTIDPSYRLRRERRGYRKGGG